MTLEIIGPGFGRTGTNSLKLALERLGFAPCHHMFEVQTDEQIRFWMDAAAGKPVDWRKGLAGFRAQVDWPGAAFWRELLAAFPEAKVVLSTRDMDAWRASVEKTILPYLSSRDPEGPPAEDPKVEMAWQVVAGRSYGGRFGGADRLVAVHRAQIEAVKAEVPAERLLVCDVRQGWAPLCRFLNVPVPDEPFPRTNTTDDFRKDVGLGGDGSPA